MQQPHESLWFREEYFATIQPIPSAISKLGVKGVNKQITNTGVTKYEAYRKIKSKKQTFGSFMTVQDEFTF